jgi:hypothetical protein
MTRMMRLEWRADATQEGRVGALRQGRGRLSVIVRPNEPEEPAEFNGLAISQSERTRFCTPGRSP